MRARTVVWLTSYLSFMGAACTDAASQADDSAMTSVGGLSESESENAGAGSETTTSPPSTGTIKFDVGDNPDISIDPGCRKVDFLFVIDSSGSMEEDQEHLVESFPGFISGIEDTLGDVSDYHVGVVTSNPYEYNIFGFGCRLLGGLVVQTGGEFSSQSRCGPYADGGSYMTQRDNLNEAFACAAQVGTQGGDSEKQMNALEAVVREDLGQEGLCNAGFMRKDALLVVVIITDEGDGPNSPDSDDESTGTAASWFDTVVAAKGDPGNAVIVTLTYINGGECPPPDEEADPRDIQTFAEMFGENGFLGCVDGDYSAIFAEATSVIDTACDNFIPPG